MENYSSGFLPANHQATLFHADGAPIDNIRPPVAPVANASSSVLDLLRNQNADFARGAGAAPGVALSFDDTSVDAWFALRETFQHYHARITFFVSRYYVLGARLRAELKVLAGDGHDIEPHSVQHMRAPEYVEDHGLNAYVHDEVDPSIAILRSEGFEVHAFAYPFGARTGELDGAIAKRVPVIRSIAYTYMFSESPCPQ